MRWRLLIAVSLVANFLLAGGWFLSVRHFKFWPPRTPRQASVPAGQTTTNVVVRRQFFSWQEVESDDYPTYVANLRAIGCPEQTVRDIIVADVNTLFARRRATEIVTPEQQWWRADMDTNVLAAAAEKTRALETERRALLTRLLGPNWDNTEAQTAGLTVRPRPAITLDGPVLGLLSPDVKQAVFDITARSQERILAYTEAQRKDGKEPDPAELARLRQQTRTELASVLSPPQLEEFLLRYSQTASALRTELGQLKYFNATPDEFRTLFRTCDPYDVQIQALAGATDPNSVAQRKSLEEQRDNAIKAALGPERYEQYQSLRDPGYREAYAQAQQAGQPDTAPVLYEINQAAAQELARISADTNFTAEQRAIELKKAELEQLKAVAQALGQDLPPEPPPPPKPTPTRIHVVKNGEGLDFLARLYGVTPGDIRAINPDLNLNRLKAGDPVRIPVFPPPGFALPQ